MSRPKKGDPPKVLRRSSADRKKMPADLEAFAGGDDDALWRRPQRRRLQDPRPVVLIPGVANRDARTVYEARLTRIRAAIEADDRAALALELAEAALLRVWRGHSIVGWEAFVDAVLGLDLKKAAALREAGDVRGPLSEELLALWVRAEAGIVLAAGSSGAVRFRAGKLCFELDPDTAPAALANMGRRAAPLAKEASEPLESLLDRPPGVPRLSKLERPKD